MMTVVREYRSEGKYVINKQNPSVDQIKDKKQTNKFKSKYQIMQKKSSNAKKVYEFNKLDLMHSPDSKNRSEKNQAKS